LAVEEDDLRRNFQRLDPVDKVGVKKVTNVANRLICHLEVRRAPVLPLTGPGRRGKAVQ
jgi:hypothetical protein